MTLRRKLKFTGSAQYWKDRYYRGGDSGAGSYGHLAAFKAHTINQFVKDHDVKSVVEFGCGDGHQLSLARYPHYVGYDVSPHAIRLCRERFQHDKSKWFSLTDQFLHRYHADLALSLDVIYHLVEDSVYHEYMHRLFDSAEKYVIIYSSNHADNEGRADHVWHRKFTDWILENKPDWSILGVVANAYPEDSVSNFYFYGRAL